MNAPARNRQLDFQLHHRLALTIEEGLATVDDMATLFECHRNTILNWISGRSTPRRRDVRQWAMRTGVSFDWLWSGTEEPPNDPLTDRRKPMQPSIRHLRAA